MVGWSRRNAESAARRRKAHAEYLVWLDTLTPEELAVEALKQEELARQDAIFTRRALMVAIGLIAICVGFMSYIWLFEPRTLIDNSSPSNEHHRFISH